MANLSNINNKFLVTTGGNVGIGTTSPNVLLDVWGATPTIRAVGTSASNPSLTLTSVGITAWSQTVSGSDSSLSFNKDGSEKMRIDTSGNVGIGTTNPVTKLHVFNAGYPQMALQSNGGTWQVGVSTGNDLAFRRGTSGSNYPLWLDSSDNVGIGTTSPSAKLHVTDGSGGDIAIGTNTTAVKYLNFGLNSDYSIQSNGGSYLRFHTEGSERMRIDNSGNVGIGTTSPITKLNVAGNIAVTATKAYRMYNAANNGWGEMSFIEADNRIQFNRGIQNSGVDWRLSENSASSYVCALQGNFGIGTTSPVQKLHIHNSTASSVSYAKFSNAQTGTTTADGFDIGVNTSDQAIVWQRENTNLLFGTNSTERMRITSAGNVGIGTTSPLKPLQVDGVIAAQRSGIEGVYARRELTGSGHELDVPSGYHSLLVKNNGSEQLRVTSAGNVGIGTTSPDSKLDVTGGDITVNTSGVGFMNFKYGSVGSEATMGSIQTTGIDLKINATSDLLLLPGSNVGIGTTSPGTILDVSYGVSASQTAQINLNGANGAAAELVMRAGGNDGGTIYNRRAAIRYYSNQISTTTAQWVNGVSMTQTTGDDKFYFNNSGNSTVLCLQQNGSVGIGTTSPQRPLHVNGTEGVARFTSTASGNNGFEVGIGTASQAFLWQSESQFMQFATSNTERMRIEAAGNVGIGTTSPDGTLHVVGKVNTNRIVSGNLIAGNIRSNLTTTTYLLLVDLNVSAGFSLVGELNAASYTTYNVSRIYIRKNYNATTGAAVITGIAKSGSNLSVVDISHSSGRFIAIKLTGDPEIDVMWTGYRLNDQFNSDGTIKILTSGVTENSVYASY